MPRFAWRMDSHDPCCDDIPPSRADRATYGRLAAIERHMEHIEAVLIGISQFNSRLDQIHATLELAIGFLTPARHTTTVPPIGTAPTDDASTAYRVIAHLSRDGNGARLASDVSWADTWSVRLYVTALLRNLARSTLSSEDCRCWCEVWTPDETGDLVDSARLDPETGVIDWDSDLRDEAGRL